MTPARITELCAETALVVYSAGFLAWYITAKFAHLMIGAGLGF